MESRDLPRFGERLKELRKAAGLSQMELAERSGLSARGISDIERGLRSTPRLDTVRMLAVGLAIEPGILIEARNSASFVEQQRVDRLPVPPTSFIGRAEEIEKLSYGLKHDRPRVLTLMGPGGVGKTRLAIALGRSNLSLYPDGADFVDLASIRSSAQVLPAIADHLGVAGTGERSIKSVLVNALQDQKRLLILDNLEQVIEASLEIAELSAACPDLTTIATSRIPLRIGVERIVPIMPFTLPDADQRDDLLDADAALLFLERARMVRPDFEVHGEHTSTLVAVLDQLQGMPLAIELAAARLRFLSLEDLQRQLAQQLDTLAGGARDIPIRHRAMRDTIAWSYDLLSSQEALALRALSVFPEGCTLETAMNLLRAQPELGKRDLLAVMESLVDSSLLRLRDGTDGLMRYRMLQTVREFAYEQLMHRGEEAQIRSTAHDTWCVPLKREAELVLSRPDASYWLNRIAAEYQNLQEHMAWLIEHDRIEDALDVSGSLASYRGIRANFDEARQELETLLAHPRNQAPSFVRLKALCGLAAICNHQTATARSCEVSQEAIALAHELGDMRYLGLAVSGKGIALARMGDVDAAEACFDEALGIAEATENRFHIGSLILSKAYLAGARGQQELSHSLLRKSLAINIEIGNAWITAMCKSNLAAGYIETGYPDLAETLIHEALPLYQELGSKRDLPIQYFHLACIAIQRNDWETTDRMASLGLALAREIGAVYDTGLNLSAKSRVARLRGDLVTALHFIHEETRLIDRSGDSQTAIDCLDNLADLATTAGDPNMAAWCIGAGDAMLADRGLQRLDFFPHEHEQRVASVKAMLGEQEWHHQYDLGSVASSDRIWADLLSWQLPDPER